MALNQSRSTKELVQKKSTPRSSAWRGNQSRARGGRHYVSFENLKGHKINPGPNPPNITYQPWNHVTVAHGLKTSESIQVKDIPELLKAQLDPEGRGFNQTTSGDKRFILQMKLKSVRAWNLTGNLIAMSVDDFIDTTAAKGGREQLCGLVDTGTTRHTPCVGYVFPMSHREHVLRSDDQEGEIYLVNVQLDTAATGMIYLDLSYKFDGPVKPPALTSMLGGISLTTSRLHEEVEQQRREVGVIGHVMDSLSHSLSQAVVSVGVEKLALLVTSLAEERTVPRASSSPSLLEDAAEC